MTGDYVALDELNDLPEIRVTAAAEPVGILRFEADRAYAQGLLEHVEHARQNPRDGFVDVVFEVDYPAYASLTKGLGELLMAYRDGGKFASKQVVVTPEQQDVAVSVFLNESQIESSMKKNYAVLKMHGEGRRYGQQFALSRNGAVMLIQQLEAFLDGAENPADALDEDDDRFPEVGA